MGCAAAEDEANAYGAAVADLVAFVESLEDADLDRDVPGEQRTVRVMLFHMANGLRLSTAWLACARRGDAVPAQDLDAYNAVEAEEHANAAPEEVLGIIARLRDEATDAVRSLDETEWERVVPFGPGGGVDMPVSRLAMAGARHIRRHMDSVAAVVHAG